jgi:hypothetical protein
VLLCFTKRSPCLGMVVHEFIHYSHKENGWRAHNLNTQQ